MLTQIEGSVIEWAEQRRPRLSLKQSIPGGCITDGDDEDELVRPWLYRIRNWMAFPWASAPRIALLLAYFTLPVEDVPFFYAVFRLFVVSP